MIMNFLFPQIDVLFSVCWEEKKWGQLLVHVYVLGPQVKSPFK